MTESSVVRSLSWGCVYWSLGTALLLGILGDVLTSKQWVYLLSIPGGKWTWALMFGTAGLLACVGLWTHRRVLVTTGLFLSGTWCLCVVLFYLVAPFYDTTLFNLGFCPWCGMGVLMVFLAGKQ